MVELKLQGYPTSLLLFGGKIKKIILKSLPPAFLNLTKMPSCCQFHRYYASLDYEHPYQQVRNLLFILFILMLQSFTQNYQFQQQNIIGMIRTQKQSPSPTHISRTPPKQKSSPPKASSRKPSISQSQKQNLYQIDSIKSIQANQQLNSERLSRKLCDANGRFMNSQHSKLNQTIRLPGFDRIEEQKETSNQRSTSKSIKSQRGIVSKNIQVPRLCLNKTSIGPETPIISRALPKYPQKSSSSSRAFPMNHSKTDRKNIESQQKVVYNYTNSISPEIAESNIGGSTNRREKQAEYNIKRHHIETMHKQIGDLLKFVNKSKEQRIKDSKQSQHKTGEFGDHRFQYTLKLDHINCRDLDNQKQKTYRGQTDRSGNQENSYLKMFDDEIEQTTYRGQTYRSTNKQNPYEKIEESVITYCLPFNKQITPCIPISISNAADKDKEIYQDFMNQYKILKAQQKPPAEEFAQKKVEHKQNKYNYSEERISSQVNANQERQTGRQTNRWEKFAYREINTSRNKQKDDGPEKYREKLRQQWVQMEEMSSEYVDVIDKQISKIKGRIQDSERVTKLMQNKYLGQTYNDRSSSPLIHKNIQPMEFTPIQQSYSQQLTHAPKQSQTQKYSYVRQFTVPHRNNKKDNQVLFDTIRTSLAKNLAKQVEIDMGLRKWREHMMEAVRQQRGKTSLWTDLCRKLSALGQSYTEQEIIQLLEINSCESNPFGDSTVSGTTPPPKNIIETLANLFMKSQQFWYNEVIGSIDSQEAQSCGFSVGVLDLNKKGYICLEDIVCFVNLYAGKFYRNRDFMLVSRRIIREEKTKQGKEKSIEYEDMESILFDNMGR